MIFGIPNMIIGMLPNMIFYIPGIPYTFASQIKYDISYIPNIIYYIWYTNYDMWHISKYDIWQLLMDGALMHDRFFFFCIWIIHIILIFFLVTYDIWNVAKYDIF